MRERPKRRLANFHSKKAKVHPRGEAKTSSQRLYDSEPRVSARGKVGKKKGSLKKTHQKTTARKGQRVGIVPHDLWEEELIDKEALYRRKPEGFKTCAGERNLKFGGFIRISDRKHGADRDCRLRSKGRSLQKKS